MISEKINPESQLHSFVEDVDKFCWERVKNDDANIIFNLEKGTAKKVSNLQTK